MPVTLPHPSLSVRQGAASAIQLGLPLLRPPGLGCVWGAICPCVGHPAPSSVAMATISTWTGRGSRIRAPFGIGLPKGSVSGCPLVCAHVGGTASPSKAFPYGNPVEYISAPRWGSPAGPPSPLPPGAPPPASPPPGPAPRPSWLGRGLSPVLAVSGARAAGGRGTAGRAAAGRRPRSPSCGVSAPGIPFHPRPGLLGFVPLLVPTPDSPLWHPGAPYPPPRAGPHQPSPRGSSGTTPPDAWPLGPVTRTL